MQKIIRQNCFARWSFFFHEKREGMTPGACEQTIRSAQMLSLKQKDIDANLPWTVIICA
jgi:hypothetical protein